MAIDLSTFRLIPLSGIGREGEQGRAFAFGTTDNLSTASALGYINSLINLKIPYGDRAIYPGDVIFLNYSVGDTANESWAPFIVKYTAASGSTPENYQLVALNWGSGGGGAVTSVFGRTGAVVATSGDYTVSEITGAAPLAGPSFTGVPTAPTAILGTSTTQLATTAFVQNALDAVGSRQAGMVATVSGALPVITGTNKITGIAYLGVGHYRLFISAGTFPDANYVISGSCTIQSGVTFATGISFEVGSAKTATICEITTSANGILFDPAEFGVILTWLSPPGP